ncbi:MAG: DUF1805 domain-containing protein [Elusimicrobia bacterium HGW-Elusimicrobia-1]|jgi:uncharacterized protein YunC (DUF1805 family)|nr:MAG: DUF1805 domain-containing protein [Elusimicrobia bacterium HGW-Elusimicrobia-1]
MKLSDVKIKNKYAQGIELPLKNATLIMIVAPKGYAACGYWNIAAAEKFGDAAFIVRGVKNIDEALDAAVADVTPAARRRGIKSGMICRKALEKLF